MNLRELQVGGECARAQARAAALFDLYNVATPVAQLGEGPAHYRRRLLSMAQSLLPADSPWRGVPVSSQSDDALGAVEAQLLDGQVTDFRRPVGPERSTVTLDDAGRKIRRFYGEPCWARLPCAQKPRRICGWSDAGRGRDSPEARQNQPVQMILRNGDVVPARGRA
jgi:hypothetical protein